MKLLDKSQKTMKFKIKETPYGKYSVGAKGDIKIIQSPTFNQIFDKSNGTKVSWGKTKDDDNIFSPFGPIILDMEVTTICNQGCEFCYKSNTDDGINMSFDTFKGIFDMIPLDFLTQIAFGVDSTAESNPDLWEMMNYCRMHDIAPNLTTYDITDETADKLALYCGAVAISCYDKDICYDSIKKLTDRGMDQVNMHFCLYEDTYEKALEVIQDIQTDPRLEKLNAIVFLNLKQKGRGESLQRVDRECFNKVIQNCLDNNITFGSDSCGGNKIIEYFKSKGYNELIPMITGCESTKESFYISVDGEAFPCSFTEGTEGWIKGIDVLSVEDFVKEVWYETRVRQFRDKLDCNSGNCPIYNI